MDNQQQPQAIQHDRCPKCKCWRLPAQFLNDKRRRLKTCDVCRNRETARRAAAKERAAAGINTPAGINAAAPVQHEPQHIPGPPANGFIVNELKEHIQRQFAEGMSWDNHGDEWHIDYILPLKYANPTIEQTIERLHYINTRPVWNNRR